MLKFARTLILCLFTFCYQCAFCQDTIVTLKNETLEVKVLEVDHSKELVKFKKSVMPDGPTYSDYLSNLFLINIQNTPSIYNDPYENPYPGYQSVVPISMKRLESYSPSEREFSRSFAESRFEECQSLFHRLPDVTESEKRFSNIFNSIVRSVRGYCRSRKFTIQDEFEWKYVYADCLDEIDVSCTKHSSDEHSFLQNAYSLGNGMFLFSDWFLYGLSDDEIAGIVCHEIGHALAQHSLEKLRKIDDLNDISHWIAVGVTVKHGGRYESNRTGIHQIGEGFFLNPYIRSQEEEADKIGVVLMKIAGYDPQAMINYWRTEGRGTRTKYWNTHPGGMDRANNIERLINSPEFQTLTKKR